MKASITFLLTLQILTTVAAESPQRIIPFFSSTADPCSTSSPKIKELAEEANSEALSGQIADNGSKFTSWRKTASDIQTAAKGKLESEKRPEPFSQDDLACVSTVWEKSQKEYTECDQHKEDCKKKAKMQDRSNAFDYQHLPYLEKKAAALAKMHDQMRDIMWKANYKRARADIKDQGDLKNHVDRHHQSDEWSTDTMGELCGVLKLGKVDNGQITNSNFSAEDKSMSDYMRQHNMDVEPFGSNPRLANADNCLRRYKSELDRTHEALVATVKAVEPQMDSYKESIRVMADKLNAYTKQVQAFQDEDAAAVRVRNKARRTVLDPIDEIIAKHHSWLDLMRKRKDEMAHYARPWEKGGSDSKKDFFGRVGSTVSNMYNIGGAPWKSRQSSLDNLHSSEHQARRASTKLSAERTSKSARSFKSFAK